MNLVCVPQAPRYVYDPSSIVRGTHRMANRYNGPIIFLSFSIVSGAMFMVISLPAHTTH